VWSPYFKSYYVTDVIGVELAGALKNVLALGSGFVDGLDFGSNSMAAFVSRGVKEIQILGKEYGADPMTVLSLAGIGDIMMCCYGNLSRNRVCGLRVAKGENLDDVIESIGTVEGVPTVSVLHEVIVEKGLEEKCLMIK
jgi:glycerol-3-phosphate dehydrogenase